jgi:glutamyl-tRNA synthetase
MRVRFAPSPTGYLHVGNARTALVNHLIAIKNKAEMTLRIEDTDRERSTRESEESILADLKWLGISWSEGPDTGGPNGPYRQSERFDIYREYTDKLLSTGDAYYCYCTREELEAMKKGDAGTGEGEQFIYNGRCRNLTDKEREVFQTEGRKPTVRFKVPENEPVIIKDLIKGHIEFNSSNIGGDFIIVRSDGIPTYNYIVTIDDALMKITHVIRGEDHLSNTPKQLLVMRALGLPEPEYAHHSLMLGPDRSKLSKRHGITSVEKYRSEGYLPEALVNYLAMLGWATESGEEILELDDIISQIDLAGLSKSAPIFDFQKLRWISGHYIRSKPLHEITDLFIPFVREAGYDPGSMDRFYLEDVISLLRGYCDILSDISGLLGMLLDDIHEPDSDADTLLSEDDSKTVIQAVYDLLETGLDEKNFSESLVNLVKERTSLKGKKLFMPIRAIITGRLKGPDLDRAMPILGYERCKKRAGYCREKYCG